MPFFRKKPVVVEAWQVPDGRSAMSVQDAQERHAIAAWCNGHHTSDALGPCIFIDTLEGSMAARPGDWVIRGVKGEFYPCKPDIFAATYDEATKEDLDTIGMRQAFNPDPSLADMARLARLLGCNDMHDFTGKVLRAMGGKANPAMVLKAWEETEPVAQDPKAGAARPKEDTRVWVLGGRPVNDQWLHELTESYRLHRASKLIEKRRITDIKDYAAVIDLTAIPPGVYSLPDFVSRCDAIIWDAEKAAGLE